VTPDELNEASRQAWEANARWWDERVGEGGNRFHRELVAPAQLRLLELQPGELLLDIACGNGQFTREVGRLGVDVVAFDFSETFIERARSRTVDAGLTNIEYAIIDATDEESLRGLGADRFDAAVCTMAIMDIAGIEPLLRGLTELLKTGGRFVFSVLHPCFNNVSCTMVVEERDRGGRLEQERSLKLSRYASIPPLRGLGIEGQPEPHYYFHRTLQELFSACFRSGFVLDGIEEPAYEEDAPLESGLGWSSYSQFPPVLVARMRNGHSAR
jgi:2-polyprenyl-3-methyl-5-hydroxy-6-metoxy-1,4-benzoquinol methylase